MFESKLKEYYLSKKSHTEKPKECSWTDAIKYTRTHYKIHNSQILKDVNLWDYDGCSQMRNISTFVCYVCNLKIYNFKQWVEHILSKKHLSKSETKVDIYSYACYGCKILMYGSSAEIKMHRINKHDVNSDLPAVSYLMAYLMNEPGIHWYFCTHCNKFSESLTEIHPFDPKHYPNEILYDCKYCDVTLLSSNEVLDCHSLSVEHVTLKSMYFIKKAVKKKEKKIKNKSKKHAEIQVAEIAKCVPSIKLKLPLIILNRFQNISQVIAKCKLCYINFDWSTKNIIQHILNVCKKPDNFPTDFNNTCPTINTYDCQICKFKAYSFLIYLNHIISLKHLSNCLMNDNLYSYICTPCNLYMYSTKHNIADHCENKQHVTPHDWLLKPKFLADNYKYISNQPECESMQLYNDLPEENSAGNSLDNIQYICYFCKIDFGLEFYDYKNHMISSEHIILKYFTLNTISLDKGIHDEPLQHSTMMYTYSTIDMESLDRTSQTRSWALENLQEGIKDTMKIECNKNNEKVFHSSILKNLEPLENNCSNISHSTIELVCSPFSEISTVSENKNDYLEVFDSELNSSANVLKEYTQGSTKYLDVSTNADNLNLQVTTLDEDEHNLNQESPIENIHIDVGNNIDHTKTPINNISTTVFNEAITDIKKLHGQQNSIDMDEEYGRYVAQRLRRIHDASNKSDIKLEIDFLFYNNIFRPTKDSIEY